MNQDGLHVKFVYVLLLFVELANQRVVSLDQINHMSSLADELSVFVNLSPEFGFLFQLPNSLDAFFIFFECFHRMIYVLN